MGTMIGALRRLQEEVDKYGPEKVYHGKWTLRELAKFVRIFNKSELKEIDTRRRVIGIFLYATHIHEIRIPGTRNGAFESREQAVRNGPMIPGPRMTVIELDIEKPQLNILGRRTLTVRPFNLWECDENIPLAKIKKIKIGRVPVGLRHLEIELHKD